MNWKEIFTRHGFQWGYELPRGKGYRLWCPWCDQHIPEILPEEYNDNILDTFMWAHLNKHQDLLVLMTLSHDL